MEEVNENRRWTDENMRKETGVNLSEISWKQSVLV